MHETHTWWLALQLTYDRSRSLITSYSLHLNSMRLQVSSCVARFMTSGLVEQFEIIILGIYSWTMEINILNLSGLSSLEITAWFVCASLIVEPKQIIDHMVIYFDFKSKTTETYFKTSLINRESNLMIYIFSSHNGIIMLVLN